MDHTLRDLLSSGLGLLSSAPAHELGSAQIDESIEERRFARSHTVRVQVWAPRQRLRGWVCPVQIGSRTRGPVCVPGASSIEASMHAARIVWAFVSGMGPSALDHVVDTPLPSNEPKGTDVFASGRLPLGGPPRTVELCSPVREPGTERWWCTIRVPSSTDCGFNVCDDGPLKAWMYGMRDLSVALHEDVPVLDGRLVFDGTPFVDELILRGVWSLDAVRSRAMSEAIASKPWGPHPVAVWKPVTSENGTWVCDLLGGPFTRGVRSVSAGGPIRALLATQAVFSRIENDLSFCWPAAWENPYCPGDDDEDCLEDEDEGSWADIPEPQVTETVLAQERLRFGDEEWDVSIGHPQPTEVGWCVSMRAGGQESTFDAHGPSLNALMLTLTTLRSATDRGKLHLAGT